LETRRHFLFRSALALPTAWAVGRVFGQDAAAPSTPPDPGIPSVPDGMEYVPRCEWSGSRKPQLARMRPVKGFDRLTVHHWGVDVAGMNTEKSFMIRRMDGLLCSHLARNYGDIGYHFVLDPTGRLWEGRSLELEGAHVCGENEHNLGVMLLGNFQSERPTDAQLLSLGRVVKWATALYSIDGHRVFGHCDLASSVCPGMNLYPQVRIMREKGVA
jgi:hypothetical protein